MRSWPPSAARAILSLLPSETACSSLRGLDQMLSMAPVEGWRFTFICREYSSAVVSTPEAETRETTFPVAAEKRRVHPLLWTMSR